MNVRDDRTDPQEALSGGFTLHARGEHAEALSRYAAADPDAASDIDAAKLLAASASAHWSMGDVDSCRCAAERAMELAERSDDDGALAWAWTAKAQLASLDRESHTEGFAYSRALRYAMRGGDVTNQVRLFINLGWRFASTGRHSIAISHLERGFQLLESSPDPRLDPMLRENLGRALLGLGRCEEALAQFDQARRRWLLIGAPQVRLALVGIGDTYATLGDASRAASAYREAARVSPDAPQVLLLALSGLARVTVVDDPIECQSALDRALDLPAALATATLYLAAGWVAYARGERGVATTYAREAERRAGRETDDASLADALELLALAHGDGRAGRLSEARMIWVENENLVRCATNDIVRARCHRDVEAERCAREKLRALGVSEGVQRVAGPLQRLGDGPRAGVEIRTMGVFAVMRDGVKVLPREGADAITTELLQLLATRRGRGTSEEELAKALLSAVPPERRNRQLRRAVSQVRRLLDPARQHGQEHYLQTEAGVVWLNTDAVAIDANEFEAMARSALSAAQEGAGNAAEMLASAIALYTGRPFDDCADVPWVVTARNDLRELYRALRRALVSQERADPERAVPWLVGLVQEDPYDADAHLSLVRALRDADRHREAHSFYAEYAHRMGEIGRDPEPMPFASRRS